MSRIAKAPVDLPAGVTATIAADAVTIKGAKGSLSLPLTSGVSVVQTDKKLQIKFSEAALALTRMCAGAPRAPCQHGARRHAGLREEARAGGRRLSRPGAGQEPEPDTRLLASGERGDPGRDQHRDSDPDRDSGEGHRSAESRPGGRRDPRHSSARALQGQGRALREREDHSERGQEEVIITKKQRRLRRAVKSRAHIRTLAVARLSVHRTPRHIYAQVTDAVGASGIA